jgi:hypothetical protein
MFAAYQACLFAAFAEFDDSMVPQAQSLRGVRDGCLRSLRRPGEMQQELVLLRMQACIHSALFAEVEKLSECIAELGESLQPPLIFCGWNVRGHVNIISYYDIC